MGYTSVAPILSLIYDQKENLDEFGIDRTCYITGEQSAIEKERIIHSFGNGQYFLAWISPERFQTEAFRETLGNINLTRNFSYAVIDEVHCVSEWGHDFRTSYLNLANTVRRYCPQVSFLGLTATASQFVLEDLKKEFEIQSESIKSVSNMSRKELTFYIKKVEYNNKYDRLKKILVRKNEINNNNLFSLQAQDTTCGLIFTNTVRGNQGCISIASQLGGDLEIETRAYYADLDKNMGKGKRKELQDEFKQNKFTIMVATKAFGMGVNKRNISYTFHYGLPWSIEAFYQEAGRAGRAKQDSDCYILYSPEECEPDILKEIFAIKTDTQRIKELLSYLNNDLSSIIYLWLLNNDGVDRDLDMMRWVMNYLHSSRTNIVTCDKEHRKSQVEKAIYRLTLLGFIKDWTIVDWSETTGVLKVETTEYSEETVRADFITYIRRYDSDFSLDDTSGKYNEYLNILKDENEKLLTRYMRALVQWSYDNIVYSRKQAINNIRVLCDRGMQSSELKRYINNYFKFSETTIVLDGIVSEPNNYELWFDILRTRIVNDEFDIRFKSITIEKAEEVLTSLLRYLESYRFNTGLNFIAGMLRIKCGQFYDSDGEERLDIAFDTIDTFPKEKKKELIQHCYEFGVQIDPENRMVLGDYLASRYKDKALEIYENLKDLGSLTIALSPIAKKINGIKSIGKMSSP